MYLDGRRELEQCLSRPRGNELAGDESQVSLMSAGNSTFPTSASAVIIGAGIMGCSIAWHLADRGMRDIVVLERDRIGGGATADAAGGIRLQFSTDTNIRLSQISLDYWEHFEEQLRHRHQFSPAGLSLLADAGRRHRLFRRNLALQQSLGVPRAGSHRLKSPN